MQTIEAGEQTVVGVNAFTTSETSPLTGDQGGILTVSEAVEQETIDSLKAWRSQRDPAAVARALDDLRDAAREGRNIMEPSIAAAKAGVTTGEWGETLREVFGQYRAPTGVTGFTMIIAAQEKDIATIREKVAEASRRLGEPMKMLVGKPGLDGHSNGAEQVAVRARDCGMDVVYDGIRLTPAEIVESADREKPHVIGLSILSGSHVPLVRDVMNRLRNAGLDHIPVIVGGIIPTDDVYVLKQCGVRAVYTPKDFALNTIMDDIVELVLKREPEAA
jgi:(2R)-ethylmalonyl-CoA mutase